MLPAGGAGGYGEMGILFLLAFRLDFIFGSEPELRPCFTFRKGHLPSFLAAAPKVSQDKISASFTERPIFSPIISGSSCSGRGKASDSLN
jgi:hypothetical protein